MLLSQGMSLPSNPFAIRKGALNRRASARERAFKAGAFFIALRTPLRKERRRSESIEIMSRSYLPLNKSGT